MEYRPIEATGNMRPVGERKIVMKELKDKAKARRLREEDGQREESGGDRRVTVSR